MTEENDDWLYDIIPKQQAEELEEKMYRIENDENTILSIVLSAPRASAIQLCQTYTKAMTGNITESFKLISFMERIVELIEQELYDSGIDPYEE